MQRMNKILALFRIVVYLSVLFKLIFLYLYSCVILNCDNISLLGIMNVCFKKMYSVLMIVQNIAFCITTDSYCSLKNWYDGKRSFNKVNKNIKKCRLRNNFNNKLGALFHSFYFFLRHLFCVSKMGRQITYYMNCTSTLGGFDCLTCVTKILE